MAFQEISIPCASNANDLPLIGFTDLLNNKIIRSLRTRAGGKSSAKLTNVSETALKSMVIELRDTNSKAVAIISLDYVKRMSELGEGKGLEIKTKLDFSMSKIICFDGASLLNTESVPLLFEFD